MRPKNSEDFNQYPFFTYINVTHIVLIENAKIFNSYGLTATQLTTIIVSIQHDAQFFSMYVYFCFLHVSGSHVSIIRRIIVSMWQLLYVTLYGWPSGLTWSLCVDERLVKPGHPV